MVTQSLKSRRWASEESLASELWDIDGCVRLPVVEILAHSAPLGYEDDFVADILDLIDEMTAEDNSRSAIAREVLRYVDISDDATPSVCSAQIKRDTKSCDDPSGSGKSSIGIKGRGSLGGGDEEDPNSAEKSGASVCGHFDPLSVAKLVSEKEGVSSPPSNSLLHTQGQHAPGELVSRTRVSQATEGTKTGMRLYVEAVQREPLLSAEEEKQLARRIIRHNDLEARKKMVQSNLRLVVSVAKRYTKHGMSLLDLISEGNLGLIQAVDAFNPSMNIRFSTYGSWWIKQAIRRALSDGGGFVRVPSYMYERLSAWQEAYAELQTKLLGRVPRIDEFAEHMKNSPDQAWAIHWAMQRAWNGSGNEAVPVSQVATGEEAPSAADAARRDDMRRMKGLLQEMDARAAMILKLRYGLDGDGPMTLDDVGARIGVTREQVRQIEIKALESLQLCLVNKDARARLRRSGIIGWRGYFGSSDAVGSRRGSAAG